MRSGERAAHPALLDLPPGYRSWACDRTFDFRIFTDVQGSKSGASWASRQIDLVKRKH